MKDNFNAGIVGFGYMGHFHLNKSKEVEGININAVYDISDDKRESAEKEGLYACSSIEELLAMDDIKLIIICTPNDAHKYYAIQALNAGKNVLCEKPATMNGTEAEEIIECAKKNKRFFTVHQNRRWDEDYLAVRQVLNNKEIGAFTTINSWTYGQRGVCYGWRADPVAGGGMLYDWGVHLIDQILQLYPNVKLKKVYGRLESILTPVVDDFFEVKLIFDNGLCANISVGTFALQPTPRWYVFGDRGTLKLDDFSAKNGGMARIKGTVKGFESVVGHKNLGPSRTMAHLEPDNFEELQLPEITDHSLDFYNNLVNAVRGLEEPFVSHQDIIRLMKVIDQIFESSKMETMLDVNM